MEKFFAGNGFFILQGKDFCITFFRYGFIFYLRVYIYRSRSGRVAKKSYGTVGSCPWKMKTYSWDADEENQIATRNEPVWYFSTRMAYTQTPKGYILIEEDYSYRKLPAQDLNFTRWESFFSKALLARPSRKGDQASQMLLELINLENITNGKIYYHKKCINCIWHYINRFYIFQRW